jgi:hypothetical protein
MTTAGQTFLSAGALFCLSFAAIALVYFADRLRPGFLEHDPEKWKPVFRKDHAQTKR